MAGASHVKCFPILEVWDLPKPPSPLEDTFNLLWHVEFEQDI